MKLDEEIYWDQLEDYANGALPLEQRQEMTTWLQENPEAQETVEGFQLISSEFKNKEEKEQFFEAHTTQVLKQLGNKKVNLPNLFIAASIALLIGTVSFFAFQHDNPSYEKLLSEYSSEVYSAPFKTRTLSNTTEWLEYYEKGDFQKVISLLNNNSPENREQFYLGLSYFYSLEYKKAVNLLLPITKSNNIYSEQAHWFLALSYLNLKNIKEAKDLLTIIEGNQWYKFGEASSLLSKIQ